MLAFITPAARFAAPFAIAIGAAVGQFVVAVLIMTASLIVFEVVVRGLRAGVDLTYYLAAKVRTLAVGDEPTPAAYHHPVGNGETVDVSFS